MPSRIPNFLHFLLFLLLTFLAIVVAEAGLMALHPHAILRTVMDQRLQLYANIAAYAIALAAAVWIFPRVWQRSFADGIRFNPHGARWALIAVGLALGWLFQGASSLLPTPKKPPIEEIFRTPGIIWVITAFGVLVAPLFEEIVFRGFLLPSFAIMVDYMRLPRPEDPYAAMAVLTEWRASDAFSTPALVVSSLLTSAAFALIHAPQLGFSWPSVALLSVVSLVLCFVRIRYKSVAASTVVHMCYNLSVFITIFVATGGFRHMDKM